MAQLTHTPAAEPYAVIREAMQKEGQVALGRLVMASRERVVAIDDSSNPNEPAEAGWYIPEPASGLKGPATNDVFVDNRDLIYTIDRDKGFDIIERHGTGKPVAARHKSDH